MPLKKTTLYPFKQLSILPSPSIMIERDTSLAEQPFNGESMVSQNMDVKSAVPDIIFFDVDVAPTNN